MPRALHLTEHHVARTFRPVPQADEADLLGWTRLDDAGIADAARGILAGRPEGAFYVFAYGSLIWAPAFAAVQEFRGRLAGWHRVFCIGLTSWRATPEAPGLMMALLPGRQCAGIVQEVAAGTEAAVVEALVRREVPFAELSSAYRWVEVETAGGVVRALTFYAPPPWQTIRTDLTLAASARLIAGACGTAGSNADYLYRTMLALEARGIRDGSLWRLQRLVADEIERLGG